MKSCAFLVSKCVNGVLTLQHKVSNRVSGNSESDASEFQGSHWNGFLYWYTC